MSIRDEIRRDVLSYSSDYGRDLVLRSREYAIENRSKSWYYVSSTLILMIGAIAATQLDLHWAFRLAISALAGLLIVRFFVLFHDFQHGAILKDSKLGNSIMDTFGVFILAPSRIWKRTHNYHHKNNSKFSNLGVGDFPLLTKQEFLGLKKSDRLIYLIKRHPLTIFLGYITVFFFDFNVKTFLESPKTHWDSLLAIILHFLLIAVFWFFFGFLGALFGIIIPFLVACGMGAYLFYAQHNFPEAYYNSNSDWDYFDAALNSSSYLKTGLLMRWFTANIGFHHVHHVNHLIPFYNLPVAMKEIPELRHPRKTSLLPRDIWACLRLKVWDSEKRKLVSL